MSDTAEWRGSDWIRAGLMGTHPMALQCLKSLFLLLLVNESVSSSTIVSSKWITLTIPHGLIANSYNIFLNALAFTSLITLCKVSVYMYEWIWILLRIRKLFSPTPASLLWSICHYWLLNDDVRMMIWNTSRKKTCIQSNYHIFCDLYLWELRWRNMRWSKIWEPGILGWPDSWDTRRPRSLLLWNILREATRFVFASLGRLLLLLSILLSYVFVHGILSGS